MNKISLLFCCLFLVACHKEKPLEKNLGYHFDRQNEATQYGRQVLAKHFAAYKQKLVERKITEIVCLPTKNLVSEPWRFECRISKADGNLMTIIDDAPFHLFGRAWIRTEPFLIDCDGILEVSADRLNKKLFQEEFDRLLVLFDAKTQRRGQ